MSVWISVEDRLPQVGLGADRYVADSDVVLVYCDGYANKPAGIRCAFLRVYRDGSQHWRNEQPGYYGSVTHWQPLPEPPVST